MKDTKRAVRRHNKQRMKEKAKKIYFGHPKAFRYCDDMAKCSCPSCGNPRKHFGQKTRQELKNLLDSF